MGADDECINELMQVHFKSGFNFSKQQNFKKPNAKDNADTTSFNLTLSSNCCSCDIDDGISSLVELKRRRWVGSSQWVSCEVGGRGSHDRSKVYLSGRVIQRCNKPKVNEENQAWAVFDGC